MRRLLIALPLIVVAALVVVFFVQLRSGGDPARIPSALIGKPAPKIALPGLPGRLGFGPADLANGRVKVVNVFASWCGPCRIEHPYLAALASEAELWGIDYEDKTDAALGFLEDLGDSFSRVGVDVDGRTAIEWGVYGVPETYVVDGAGIIRWKHVGPLSPDDIQSEMIPAIRAAAGPLTTP